MTTSGPEFKLFVSHIHEEAPLAAVVKAELEDAFAGRLSVFVSSHIHDNPGGEDWEAKIRTELKDPKFRMLIALVSPQSVTEPWISVEMGATWILGVGVFPLCHSGQQVGNLPRPMHGFGGAELSSDDAAQRLIAAVEKATGARIPKGWSRHNFLDELRAAAGEVAKSAPPVRDSGRVQAMMAEVPPPPPQVAILRMLANVKNQQIEDIPEFEAPRQCGIAPAEFIYHAEILKKRGWIHISHYGGGAHYSLAPKGAGWLIQNNQMPSAS